MNSGLLLSSPDMDLATAGFSVSGTPATATGLAGPEADAAPSVAPNGGAVRGLVPPPAVESWQMGTGLQGPAEEGGNGGDQPQSAWGHAQRLGLGPRFDPHFLRHAVGTGGLDPASGRLIPVDGGGSGARAPVAGGSPFEMSVNPRAAAAFDALSNVDPNMDITGTLTAIRDSHDIGSYLNELQAKDAVEKLKGSIGKMLLIPPTEGQLGALPGYVNNAAGEAVPVYDQKDLLERYRSALRMATLERQGSIELDHDNWQIKSIGSAKLTPEQFVKEVRDRYQAAFADGVNEADARLAAGERPFGETVPLELQRGIFADRQAKKAVSKYLDSTDVPEGPGQIVALNRWAYYQDASGLHGQPDLLIDAGIAHRHILDGKATVFEDLSPPMRRQLEGYYALGPHTVEWVTQHGSFPVSRRNDSGRKK